MTDITRRTLITGAALAATAACTSPNRPTEAGTSTTPPSTMPVTPPQRRSGGGNVLLAYFSRAGENHWEGGRRNLDIGNTKVVAQHIADQIGCDVYEITAADLYPFAYSPTVERNQREQDRDDRPALAAAPSNLSRYTTVLLGSPVWNTRAPMIMRTLLDSTEALAGKTIHPFITYAVGEGLVFDDYRQFCPDATVSPGLAIRGEEARTALPAVEAWLRKHGLLTG